MPQEAIKPIELTDGESITATQPEAIAQSPAMDVLAFIKNNWPFWNTATAPLNQATEGFEEIGRHLLALAHNSFVANLAISREILDVKTFKDLADLQSRCANNYINSAVAETTKLSELTVKAVGQMTKPLQTHIAATFGKIGGFV